MEKTIQIILVMVEGVVKGHPELFLRVEDAGRRYEEFAISHPLESGMICFRKREEGESWLMYVQAFQRWQDSDQCPYDKSVYELYWFALTVHDSLLKND